MVLFHRGGNSTLPPQVTGPRSQVSGRQSPGQTQDLWVLHLVTRKEAGLRLGQGQDTQRWPFPTPSLTSSQDGPQDT